MFDISNDASDLTTDVGSRFPEIGEAIRNQYANNKALESVEAVREMSPHNETALQNATQFAGELNAYGNGALRALSGNELSEFLRNNTPPEIPDTAGMSESYPEIANSLAKVEGSMAQLSAIGECAGYGLIVSILIGMQTLLEELFVELLDAFAPIEPDEITIPKEPDDIMIPIAPGEITIPTDLGGDAKEFTVDDYESIAAETMEMVFTPEVVENWPYMSIEQREAYIESSIVYLHQALGIEAPNVTFYNGESGDFGYRMTDGSEIGISTRLFNDGTPGELYALLDTVTHETFHQFQGDVISNPENYPGISSERIAEWERNQTDYISPEDDFEGYQKQALEADARAFAAGVLARMRLSIYPDEDAFY